MMTSAWECPRCLNIGCSGGMACPAQELDPPRTPAPASDDAMGVWIDALANYQDSGFPEHAAAIIQQYGDQREAAGFRRAVEAAAKVAAQTIFDARTGEIDTDLRCVGHHLETSILSLIETQEKG